MIIDHVSVGVDCVDTAEDFYNTVLATIGVKQLAKLDGLVAYGKEFIQFVAIRPFDSGAATPGNGVHVALVADSPSQVDAFHKVSLAAGGSCEGKPGPRPYPHREVYAAFVRDPFGNKIEVLTQGFSD